MSSRPSRGAARLAAILDALPDALLLVNANGTVVNANTIALEAFEAPGTALVGRGLLDLLPQFDSKLIPGSMRRPDHMDPAGRTKPTRMVARRTDGTEFPVEVTSANLENPQQAYDGSAYTGDELLMLVVRDLSGTVDTEAELARSQRQTEMILRAASEGVVGTDTDGRIVLVNPAAAQILGYRAGELGGRELHTLVLHSRADGSPFPYDESPLADTLRSGRKHRVRGQVLWSKAGDEVSVDLTTAPVRDGDQLVGAVMTFTDRRPYQSLADEKETLEKAHAKELERLAEEHAADLTALRQKHATEVEELTERGAAELTELRERLQEELAAGEERYAALGEREKDRYDALAGRHEQLLTLLASSLRGPLDELRRELAALAADDAGQLWPEANQVLHHLSAGYARITALIDNVLGFQRLDSGTDDIARTKVMLDAVVAAGVDGAVELIGPGRVQFAVHAPPIEAEVDPQRLATALAHLVADVAGVDATGNAPVSSAGYLDNTVVVAAAQRGEVARIEVRGPYAGGDPVHEPIVRGIVRAHGGVLQTHEVPGMSGRAYVLEVPLGGGAGTVAAPVPDPRAAVSSGAEVALVGDAGEQGGRRRARRSSTDAFLDSEVAGAEAPGAAAPTGRRRRRGAPAAEELAPAAIESAEPASSGTGRRRGRPAEVGDGVAAEGAVMTAAEHAAGTAASNTGLGGAVPPQGVPVPAGQRAPQGAGEQAALPPALPAPSAEGVEGADGTDGAGDASEDAQPTGRRRRALAAAAERAAAQDTGARTVFALPPAEADRAPEPETPGVRVGPLAGAPVPGAGTAAGAGVAPGLAVNAGPVPVRGLGQGVGPVPAQAPAPMPGVAPGPVPAQGPAPMPTPVPAQAPAPAPVAPLAAQAQPPVPPQPPVEGEPGDGGRHDAVPVDQSEDHTPPQPHPTTAPTGRRRRAVAQPAQQEAAIPAQAAAPPAQPLPVPAQATAPEAAVPAQPLPAEAAAPAPAPAAPGPVPQPWPDDEDDDTAGAGLPGAALPPQFTPQPRAAQPLPAEAPDATQGRAISVRTLGQGVPFVRQAAQVQQPTATPPPHATNGSGRRRKLGTPPPRPEAQPEAGARPHPEATPTPAQPRRAPGTEGVGRSYAIGAPDANAAEGPEPLDGPGGAVEVADTPRPQPMDDELPPEPLDNPRRLLVWPAPDVTTSEALSTRGYRPVVVHSREEVDAQIAAFPAALFVDPLTGPITRTALQSLRQAAVAAEVPVLVTAGLGQASREAAYGADPAVLLKALAPRDSEQHPPRVLLIEEHAEIALALTATLERRGMQVARAASDADAVTLAGQFRPNLVVMDLMQTRQRQAGIVDWLRANGQLDRTPLVVYTAAVEQADLPKLASGETVLFLAERSTSDEVQGRIVDLLARIGTN
ncbi:PAS domain-containing protein [Streptomyces seoulensis]|uniref:hybrid sensor histidine kinase/response regulator n=1 Tax=Streptomyces seoulensis TaxID=73044 RepID=UPI003C2E541B